MLSKFGLLGSKSASFLLPRVLSTSASSWTHSILVNEGPERDLVNFPRPVRREKAAVRIGIFPEEWFHAMYDKTGVCGPYIFGVGTYLLLLSKEIVVYDHELAGFHFSLVPLIFGIKVLTPKVNAWLEKEQNEKTKDLTNYRDLSMKSLTDSIKSEERSQVSAKSQHFLFNAKKENIALQLEREFRSRQVEVHSKVKRYLDYQVQADNVVSSFMQKNLVDWVQTQVYKNITQKQEQETIKSCIAELKLLAKAV